MFVAGFLGWIWDAFDYFTVSLTITDIAKDFGVSIADVSWVRTFTTLLLKLSMTNEQDRD